MLPEALPRDSGGWPVDRRRRVTGGADRIAGISVQVDGGASGGGWEALLVRAVTTVLREEDVRPAELSLALLDDAAMARLNREHLGRDGPTDVLAFSLWDEGEPVVGDVYVGLEQAARQARAEGVTLPEELVRLAVHGTLHVLGWDHPEGDAERVRSAMWRRQEALVVAVLGPQGR